MKIKKLNYGLFGIVFCFSLLFTSFNGIVQAAAPEAMYLSQPSISAENGQEFTVQVRANLTTTSADAAQIGITFPASSLTLVSHSLTGAVFSNEQNPTSGPGSFDTAVYETGGSPDVTGDVLLYTLVFRAETGTGTALIDLIGSSCTVLVGVCSSTSNEDATVTFSEPATPPAPVPVEETYSDSQPALAVQVNTGTTRIVTGVRGDITISCGVFKGTGTVGEIFLQCGTLAPGLSPGVLNSGNFTATGGTFAEEIGGTTLGEYDRINVTGTVDLGSATVLSVSHWNNYRPALNDQFVIINNDGNDAIVGTFQGLAQGANLTIDSVEYTISYTGGDGNDVVLTATTNGVTAAPATPNTGFALVSDNTAFALTSILLAFGAILYSIRLATKK